MLAQSSRLLRARGVQKRFGRKLVLNDAGLDLYAGEAVALVGENGSGKTTLLRICAGLLRPDTGHVEVAARLGYAPQEPGLFDLLNADEHLELFGAGMGLGPSQARDEGQAVLHQLGFPVGFPSVARDLSGGTRQKLNLALALLGDPALLVLDEPYQGFDRGTYVSFWDLVDQWRAAGKGILVVTHLLSELNRVDRVIELRVVSAQSPAGS